MVYDALLYKVCKAPYYKVDTDVKQVEVAIGFMMAIVSFGPCHRKGGIDIKMIGGYMEQAKRMKHWLLAISLVILGEA